MTVGHPIGQTTMHSVLVGSHALGACRVANQSSVLLKPSGIGAVKCRRHCSERTCSHDCIPQGIKQAAPEPAVHPRKNFFVAFVQCASQSACVLDHCTTYSKPVTGFCDLQVEAEDSNLSCRQHKCMLAVKELIGDSVSASLSVLG